MEKAVSHLRRSEGFLNRFPRAYAPGLTYAAPLALGFWRGSCCCTICEQ